MNKDLLEIWLERRKLNLRTRERQRPLRKRRSKRPKILNQPQKVSYTSYFAFIGQLTK